MNKIKNIKEFEEILNKENLIVIKFFAEWCGACKVYGPIFEEFSNRNSKTLKFKAYTVNVDEVPEISQRYNVMSIPNTIIIKNKDLKEQIIGVASISELVTKIQNIK